MKVKKPDQPRRGRPRREDRRPIGYSLSFEQRWLNTEEAACHLRSSPAALAKMRRRGNGPTYVKVGKQILYRVEDVDAWLEARRRTKIADDADGAAPDAAA
jgi:hypothetical protein